MFSPETKVLIIDDMKTMRKIVALALKSMGLQHFSEGEDGIKGWEALNAPNANIDLIISDWNMPNCTGLDLLKRVRSDSRFAKIPFVLVTAESEKSQVIEAVKAGVSAYVVKPFDAESLRAKLEEAHKRKT